MVWINWNYLRRIQFSAKIFIIIFYFAKIYSSNNGEVSRCISTRQRRNTKMVTYKPTPSGFLGLTYCQYYHDSRFLETCSMKYFTLIISYWMFIYRYYFLLTVIFGCPFLLVVLWGDAQQIDNLFTVFIYISFVRLFWKYYNFMGRTHFILQIFDVWFRF